MNNTQTTTFHNLSIAPRLLDAIGSLGYTSPTPIQLQAIPPLIAGKDLFGIAQTGTGKTLAFAVPVIQQLARVKGISLVIVPTRELALQVHETFEKLGRKIGLRSAVIIGGADMQRQTRMLKTRPHVIVGTPGRMIDHITRKSLQLSNVTLLVLDEADLMLDMGFAPQIERILETVPLKRQTMLFSATMPAAIQKIAATYMINPVHIQVSPVGSTPEKVTQAIQYVSQEQKVGALETLLAARPGTAIVFVRTKHRARKLTQELCGKKFNAVEIHSDRSLSQRRAALDAFKAGRVRILVATDIAARGIDVSCVGMVVNFDLPEKPEDYIHRIGRTGRAGNDGYAVSLATRAQRQMVGRIERLLGITISASIPKISFDSKGIESQEKRSEGYRPQGKQGRTSYEKRNPRFANSRSGEKSFAQFPRRSRPKRSSGLERFY